MWQRMEGRGRFPAHWGDPPTFGTRDLRTLPGGYGRGSGTLASWIRKKMDKDSYYARDEVKAPPSHRLRGMNMKGRGWNPFKKCPKGTVTRGDFCYDKQWLEGRRKHGKKYNWVTFIKKNEGSKY